jgi:endonuclease YncB( thermonuclease family)
MNTLLRTCLLTVALACLGIAEEFSGRVVAVMDGDTITVLVGREQRRVRLAGVDAPEKGQAFGQRSRQALSQMVFGQQVTVVSTGRDRYERTLGIVRLMDGSSVNERLVQNGWAWHYTRYSKDRRLAELESRARVERRGLWVDPRPVAPWDFRNARRSNAINN